ncbi:secretion system protein [Sphingomonas sp. Leaf24]|uniref:type II and III secretion system protein family protein n=1 Tax=unclassified Sphingomonas TaxID=196159 RepID=UPI0006F9EFD4|nr:MULTISPECIES: type II and III secretion system protein family protein [unclassified Sphingomonas]KQM22969.1 secretion system protein [Sphingomonas sp. Leaf5]KQM95827.1 secretion system protein [Sphingomonas sp. Leaf24]
MRPLHLLHRSLAATLSIALVAGPVLPVAAAAPAPTAPAVRAARIGTPAAGVQRPTNDVQLSIGQGELITLPSNVVDVWVSNPGAADVYVGNPRQIHLFGKADGEATVFATNASGAVIYSANVRVGQNLTSLDRMLKAAMPEADIRVTTVGQLAVLNGTIASPADSAQAERLVVSLLNPGVATSDPNAVLKVAVINRLKLATPLQVNLQVRIAEVSRNFVKNIGVNLTSRDRSGGFLFGIAQGRQGTITTVPGIPGSSQVIDANRARIGDTVFTAPAKSVTGTTLNLAGRLLGLELLGALDLGERIGQVTTLANPNLTALSGETGSFLAGGEIPIPVSQGLGAVSVQYKQYGVSLAYTPTVLADGRISLRVRPEVSQLSAAGAVQIDGTTIPALTTRRAETTVELGSGQSMMIGGLLSNSHDNSIDKAPGLGDLPILGSLFRSNGFTRNETELVIVITPYLVKPVDSQSRIALPTDAYSSPGDVERVLMGQLQGQRRPDPRPVPTMAPQGPARPSIGLTAPVPVDPATDTADPVPPAPRKGDRKAGPIAPGFSIQ